MNAETRSYRANQITTIADASAKKNKKKNGVVASENQQFAQWLFNAFYDKINKRNINRFRFRSRKHTELY